MQLEGAEFQILGYDARRVTPDWRGQRAEGCWDRFLLRTDLEQPLSTDDAVWDFALDWDDPNVGQPDWTGPFQDLWENLEDLEKFLAKCRRLAMRPYWVIAIARARNTMGERAAQNQLPNLCFQYEGVDPAAPQASWEFLGYDVSDYFQLSGLMNCGYCGDGDSRGGYFAGKLSAFHLFDSFADADQCRQWMDERVGEHAPFFVYALFKIREEA